MEDHPIRSRRNSLTSFASTTSMASAMTSTAPRDLSTDSMYNLDAKFIRKSRSKIHPNISRSNSMASIPRHHSLQSLPQPANPTHQHQQRTAAQPQQQNLPQQQHPGYRPKHRSYNSSKSQAQRGTFYFPNGEIFTPRQTPKARHRPSKIDHHHYQNQQQQQQQQQVQSQSQSQPAQRPFQLVQSPSLPNLVPNQHRVPPRRNPGLVRNSMSFQNPIMPQQPQAPAQIQAPVQAQQSLQLPLEFQHEKGPSSASSSGSSSFKLHQVSDSSSTASLNALNSSSSPSPSNTDDTPASSISYDEKFPSLTSEVSCFEKINEEPSAFVVVEDGPEDILETSAENISEEKTLYTAENVREVVTAPVEVIQAKLGAADVSKSKPVQASVQQTRPQPVQRRSQVTTAPAIEKKSSIGKFFKKLFGGSSKKRSPSLQKHAEPVRREPTPVKEINVGIELETPMNIESELKNTDYEEYNGFEIDFDEELRENESVASFTVNDEEDVQISKIQPQTTEKEQKEVMAEPVVEKKEVYVENDDYLKFEDENFLRKLIEVGETTFPDLDKPDLGTTRRKSLKLQKSLNRNSTISSQNSNSSVKTFKTASSFSEDVDRMVSKFLVSSQQFENEHLEIVRNETLKMPKTADAFKNLKSSIKLNNSSVAQKGVKFENKIYLNDTYSASDYDRYNFELKKNYQILSFNPSLIKEIRLELNSFKQMMEVHELSRQNTQFFN